MPDLEDISPLYNLTQLERLWLGRESENIPPEQIEEIKALLPNCIVNATDDPNDYGWRYTRIDPILGNVYHPRYELLREQFDYKNSPYCYSFSMNDPYFYKPAPTPED